MTILCPSVLASTLAPRPAAAHMNLHASRQIEGHACSTWLWLHLLPGTLMACCSVPRIVMLVTAGCCAQLSERSFTWIRHITQDPVIVTAANCTAVTSCTQPAATICPLVKLCPDNSTVSVTVCDQRRQILTAADPAMRALPCGNLMCTLQIEPAALSPAHWHA